jgi:hypothetical protein
MTISKHLSILPKVSTRQNSTFRLPNLESRRIYIWAKVRPRVALVRCVSFLPFKTKQHFFLGLSISTPNYGKFRIWITVWGTFHNRPRAQVVQEHRLSDPKYSPGPSFPFLMFLIVLAYHLEPNNFFWPGVEASKKQWRCNSVLPQVRGCLPDYNAPYFPCIQSRNLLCQAWRDLRRSTTLRC